MPERIIIVGAGIAGLTVALALNHLERDVIILECDGPPPAGSSEEAFASWQRPRVPQMRHSHGFLGRLRNLIRNGYPKLYAALLEAGVRERNFVQGLPPHLRRAYAPHAEDEYLTAFLCRRTTFEQVLHRYVTSLPGVQLQTGIRVTGLLMRRAGAAIPCVHGVSVQSGTCTSELSANVVIDASGCRSLCVERLRAAGARVEEESQDTGILYFTRFYRLLEGCEEPDETPYPRAGDLNYLKFGVFPADRGTFSVTLVVPTIERDLRILRREAAFQQVCLALPSVAMWIDPARAAPLGRVIAMPGRRDYYRHFVVGRRPAATGVFAIGEAALRTNPIYGRGCSLCIVHAHLLARILASTANPVQRALRFAAVTRAELYPFYKAAAHRDQEFTKRAHEAMDPHRVSGLFRRFVRSFSEHGVVPAMEGDIEVRRASRRDFHLLERPWASMKRPDIVLRILYYWLRGRRRNTLLYPPKLGPERTELRRHLGLGPE